MHQLLLAVIHTCTFVDIKLHYESPMQATCGSQKLACLKQCFVWNHVLSMKYGYKS